MRKEWTMINVFCFQALLAIMTRYLSTSILYTMYEYFNKLFIPSKSVSPTNFALCKACRLFAASVGSRSSSVIAASAEACLWGGAPVGGAAAWRTVNRTITRAVDVKPTCPAHSAAIRDSTFATSATAIDC